MYTYKYPRPALTVDSIVLYHQRKNEPFKLLLIQRKNPPFQGLWAFPGGFVDMDEDLEHAAKRELLEETGLIVNKLTQFRCYGAIDRDPRGRTVSVVYFGEICGDLPSVEGGDDAATAQWFSLDNVPPLAFDHSSIINELKEFLGV